MNLAISNIAWEKSDDAQMYMQMKTLGFTGLEIAPTRIFPQMPYQYCSEAEQFAAQLKENYGLSIVSMQSIWHGKNGTIFESDIQRQMFVDYTKEAIHFAEAVQCPNLVFGCPRNRAVRNEKDVEAAKRFFYEIGEYAYKHHTCIAVEPNPVIYHTNFLNTTAEAIAFLKAVGTPGCKLNLDVGAMIYNSEDVSIIKEYLPQINHVHISEPYLKRLEKRKMYHELYKILKGKYAHYISIEMAQGNSPEEIFSIMEYVKEIFL